jgi:hypothetical protein
MIYNKSYLYRSMSELESLGLETPKLNVERAYGKTESWHQNSSSVIWSWVLLPVVFDHGCRSFVDLHPTGYVIQRPYSESGNKHYFVFLFLQLSLRSSVLKRFITQITLYWQKDVVLQLLLTDWIRGGWTYAIPNGGLPCLLCSNSLWYLHMFQLSNIFLHIWNSHLFTVLSMNVVNCSSSRTDIIDYYTASQ